MEYIVRTYFFFFFNDTATTEIYTLSLHDALPISGEHQVGVAVDESRGDPGAGEVVHLVRRRPGNRGLVPDPLDAAAACQERAARDDPRVPVAGVELRVAPELERFGHGRPVPPSAPQERQVEAVRPGALDGALIAGVGVAHHAARRIVPQHPLDAARGRRGSVAHHHHAGGLRG